MIFYQSILSCWLRLNICGMKSIDKFELFVFTRLF